MNTLKKYRINMIFMSELMNKELIRPQLIILNIQKIFIYQKIKII